MKWRFWFITFFILIVLGVGFRFFVLGSFIDPDDAIGLSKQEVRERFGEPDWIVPLGDEGTEEVDWVYYHGLRGSSLHFEGDVVTDVAHRTR